MHIGSKLKVLRKQRGFTQKQLAELTDISPSFLTDIEKERSNPSFDKLKKLCSVLKVSPNYFIDHPDDDNNSELFNNIQSLMENVKCWNEEDQKELYSYLKAKILSKK